MTRVVEAVKIIYLPQVGEGGFVTVGGDTDRDTLSRTFRGLLPGESVLLPFTFKRVDIVGGELVVEVDALFNKVSVSRACRMGVVDNNRNILTVSTRGRVDLWDSEEEKDSGGDQLIFEPVYAKLPTTRKAGE